ncbi:MAG: DUF1592 domain-containing protein [Myxococcales bacterium]
MRTARTVEAGESARRRNKGVGSTTARIRVLARTLSALVPLGLVACEGMIGGPRGPGAPGAPLDLPGSTDSGAPQDPEEMDPGPAPMLLLTNEQYANSVRALFGDIDGLSQVLGHAISPSALGLVQGEVGPVEVERYQQAANLIAETVARDPKRLSTLAPCAAGATPRTCADNFVRSFGARLYRAPLSDDVDIPKHLALYDVGAATDHAHGMELLLKGMLQAPRFLYRVEFGTDNSVSKHAVTLSGYERATRLSYLLWNEPPDARLLAAAEQGALDSAEGVSQQLDWMLADPRGATAVRRFLWQWLRLDELDYAVKDTSRFPEWDDPQLKAALRAQAQRFLDYVLNEAGADLGTLLTSPTVFSNAAISSYYGAGEGTSFAIVDVPADRSAGILTLPALLALLAKPDESSPIYRGKFVRESLLCQTLPSPPANVPKPPEVQAGVTTRERLRQHEVDPNCSNCHKLMDPIGFGFEHFDALGRYRSEDGGRAVDATGELLLGAAGSATASTSAFDGVAALANKLAGLSEVESCMVRQWFRFSLNRFEQPVDDTVVASLVRTFHEQGGDLKGLPRAMITSDAFLHLRPREVSP